MRATAATLVLWVALLASALSCHRVRAIDMDVQRLLDRWVKVDDAGRAPVLGKLRGRASAPATPTLTPTPTMAGEAAGESPDSGDGMAAPSTSAAAPRERKFEWKDEKGEDIAKGNADLIASLEETLSDFSLSKLDDVKSSLPDKDQVTPHTLARALAHLLTPHALVLTHADLCFSPRRS